MIKSHKFSPNNKIVAGAKHNFSMPGQSPKTEAPNESTGGGSAEPAGGGAQGPAPEAFCNGGQRYDDGGAILGGGIRGKMADYGSALKDTWNQMTSTSPKGGANSDPVASAQASAQKSRNKTIDDTVDSAVNGDDK
jgi:hypothetical protein